jgi:hypothetical protein
MAPHAAFICLEGCTRESAPASSLVGSQASSPFVRDSLLRPIAHVTEKSHARAPVALRTKLKREAAGFFYLHSNARAGRLSTLYGLAHHACTSQHRVVQLVSSSMLCCWQLRRHATDLSLNLFRWVLARRVASGIFLRPQLGAGSGHGSAAAHRGSRASVHRR